MPGNHDEGLRDYCGLHFGGIELHRDIVHTTAAGKKYLVLHGDEFRHHRALRALARIFSAIARTSFALWLNQPLNWIRRKWGRGYWSLSSFLKRRVKTAVNFIGEFEDALAAEGVRRGVDGIICGHIHHSASRHIGDLHYLNCGDWVESCTAIAETESGEMLLIDWLKITRDRAAVVDGSLIQEAAAA